VNPAVINIYGVSPNQLEELMLQMEQKKYRAEQLLSWIYLKRATSFDIMSDVSLSFRELLKEKFCFEKPSIFKKQLSSDGTIKLLLEMKDGARVETVLMRYEYGNVICISSQVGCNMGCSFCASGLLKKTRNLETSEMMGQFLVVNDLLNQDNEHITHVVVMGTGEPFDNYDNVMSFVRIINYQKGLAIGARHITVSTCGLVDKIKRYAHEGIQINLAISLHASNDATRNEIMKINKAYPIKDIIEAAKYYEQEAGRRVTFEYILLKGINDSISCADELSDLIRGMLAYVNLIPYNEVNENSFKRSDDKTIHDFLDRLTKRGITATIRKEFGSDIDAACGQLRAKYSHNES
jgi:23S rRNA (adenine2503-C2)-methyltransferase